MDKLVIDGGHSLHGEIEINGAKNAAVAIIPAAILVDGVCCIENVPKIEDVKLILKMLKALGAAYEWIDEKTVKIDSSGIDKYNAPYNMAQKMRASYYLLGALLGRFNKAEVALPGGCHFGERPIDFHIKGFTAMGSEVEIERGQVNATAKDGLKGTRIYFDKESVGATINIMLAATRADGTTIIENAAKEPHIVDTANFLNAMGANIKGAGTDTIRIRGVKSMPGGTYSIIPDQIEAGTYMIAAAATGGDVLIKNVIPRHMESLTSKLKEAGIIVKEYDDSIRIVRDGEIRSTTVVSVPYPGFPTDLQPQIVAFLSMAKGTSMVTETVFENRFQYVAELKRLGADIKVEGRTAIITGKNTLYGAPVESTDLRAGAALIIAALGADGITELGGLNHIDRGYYKIEEKLKKVGAHIERVSVDD